MALWCFKSRIRLFISLTLVCGVSLFLLNLATQLGDYPPSGGHGNKRLEIKHELIDSWRKEKLLTNQKPVIAPVPCKGSKCAKFMNVFGMDEKAGGGNSQVCKHPLLLPENDTIGHEFVMKAHDVVCTSSSRAQTRYHSPNDTILHVQGHVCLLRSIIRPTGSDDHIELDREKALVIRRTTKIPASIKSDFFKLSCVYDEAKLAKAEGSSEVEKLLALENQKMIDYHNFISRVYKHPEGRPEYNCSAEKCMPYSVLVIGVGSLSHMSFRRLLPKTYEYFTQELDGIVMSGYNVVGRETSGALFPLLTGLDEDSSPEVGKNKQKSHFVDKLDMIWTEYDNDGYITLYAEDNPKTNTFNSRFHGFEMPPTTHYMRPFWLAIDEDEKPGDYCIAYKQTKHGQMTDYITEFHRVYAHEKTFAVAMFKHNTHKDILHAKFLDNHITSLIRNALSSSSETIIFLMTDYGAAPDKTLMSWQAKAEARMPLMSVYLPKSFFTKYKDSAHALVDNENVLSTPYDVYMTLKDIGDVRRLNSSDERDKNKHGQSLFKPIPINRTCKSAGVDIHWCACLTQFPTKGNQISTDQLGDTFLQELNKKSTDYRQQCAVYQRITLLNVTRLVPTEEIIKYESETNQKFTADSLLDVNYYQATARLTNDKLGQGDIYEATFEMAHGGVLPLIGGANYKLVSDIVRLNKVPLHNCIEDKDIIRYCSCSS